ncbi:hypothetical protein FDC58_14815 [Clostridium botulinum]|uniref:Uncharacterized protein n=2 Tax=Clostridium botulinum TaxID=1491 RepID=A0A0A0UTC1_CLOBO|nr:hypothetical protein [Clostridium botulinum]AIW54766.1 hypothetical protein [Clostridium botulinum]MBY7009294.1 hypothetical protein [Clostridium botulinum]NFH74289.1 hypothetical protein [Clostridium botulinum]NFI02342.1 hypothetical protein [Clostridium botulinum]
MSFEDAYKYLIDKLKGKNITLGELNNEIAKTEKFDYIDGGILADCIIEENNKKYCSFNSYANNNQVISIDIEFQKMSDLKIIKEMLWNNINECNNFMVRVKKIYIYE